MNGWRRYLLGVDLWLYGIAVTVTLVSLWGRAVVVDSALVSSAAADAAAAGPVAERIESWLAGELAERAGVGAGVAGAIAAAATEDPALEATFTDLVEAVVLAATSDPGQEATVDVAAILAPAAPALALHLHDHGIALDESAVEAAVTSIDPLVVRMPGEDPPAGHGSQAARTLTRGTAIGLVVAVITGAVAVYLAEDRRIMFRSLLNRIALSALGFAVMFQLGSWILDPGAGRAPIRLAAARLVGAKLWLPALIALGFGGAGWTLRNRVRRRPPRPGEASPSPDAPAR